MKNQLEKLSETDRLLLLKAPALISVLAASTDGIVDNEEKADAIELAHWRTFSIDPQLQSYYQEVEKLIKLQLEQLIQQYSPFEKAQKLAIQKELEKINKTIEQLDGGFGNALKISLNSYAKHVGNIHQHFLEFFVFPFYVSGVTE